LIAVVVLIYLLNIEGNHPNKHHFLHQFLHKHEYLTEMLVEFRLIHMAKQNCAGYELYRTDMMEDMFQYAKVM
jgi:hypothetical protein